jgi:hypothetical protein
MPKLIKIFVSRAGMSTRLRLRDDKNDPGEAELTTEADPGDTIVWELDPKSTSNPPKPGFFPIGSIIDIKRSKPTDSPRYANSVAVLDSDPIQGPNGTFIGTVKNPSVGEGKAEDYMITYTLPGETGVFEQDPKIQMSS